MNREQKTLLLILQKALFGHETDFPADTDWEKVFEEARLQSVALLAYENTDHSLLPQDVNKRWQQYAMNLLAHNIRINHDHGQVHQWMSSHGIPYVILKGSASARWYPVPIQRTLGDVDFLVPAGQIEEAGAVLKQQGLSDWQKEHEAHIVYNGNDMDLELHFRVPGIPYGQTGELCEQYLQDIFAEAVEYDCGGETMIIPSSFHHGLILLLHTCHHLTGEGIGLRHLCDWAVFVSAVDEREFVSLFEEKLKVVGLWHFACVLTQLSVRYLGAPAVSWCGEENEELTSGLMEDILAGGNFGRKERQRREQTIFISSRGKNGVGKTGMVKQFVLSVNERIRLKWPFTGRNIFFLLIGWIMYTVRYAFLLVTGKRKMAADLISNSARRRDLYSQLRVYEPEQ